MGFSRLLSSSSSSSSSAASSSYSSSYSSLVSYSSSSCFECNEKKSGGFALCDDCWNEIMVPLEIKKLREKEEREEREGERVGEKGEKEEKYKVPSLARLCARSLVTDLEHQKDVVRLAGLLDPSDDHMWSLLYKEWCYENGVRLHKPMKNPCRRLCRHFDVLVD